MNGTRRKKELCFNCAATLISLYRLDAVLCYNHLPRIFSSLMSYYLSDHSTLSKAAQETMNVSLLEHELIYNLFWLLHLLLRFCSDWDDIHVSNTQDSVSLAIQAPWISWTNTQLHIIFNFSSWYLDIPVKHCLLCLIYYFPLGGQTSQTVFRAGQMPSP